MDIYDSSQADSYDKSIKIMPVEIGFSDNSKYNYCPSNSVGTKQNILLSTDNTKYSKKVHVFAWITIVSAILGLFLSALGMAIHDKSVGFLSVLSFFVCGIALVIWIESARRERNFY